MNGLGITTGARPRGFRVEMERLVILRNAMTKNQW